MKKIFWITLLAVLTLTFSSCNKEQNIEETIKQFIAAIQSTNIDKDASTVNFDLNPFDEAGAIHNKAIYSILNDYSFDSDSSEFIKGVNLYCGFEIQDLNLCRHILQKDYPMIFNEDGMYQTTYVGNLINIPQLEKSTLNAFFQTIIQFNTAADKISACKNAEKFIINSKEYSSDMKERILSALAIYRYSTHLWNNVLQTKGKCTWENVYNTFDALGEYLGREYGSDIEEATGGSIMIEDGKDLYHYAALVSLTAAVAFSFSAYTWFFC